MVPMVDRIALAIRGTLHLVTNEEREASARAAMAVLLAMREPTQAILAAMEHTVPANGHEWDFAEWMAVEHWQAMIDAALTETTEGIA